MPTDSTERSGADLFKLLYARLCKINFAGTAGDPAPDPALLAGAIDDGGLLLPLSYVTDYVKPLQSNLAQLQQLAATQRIPNALLEALSAAVYLHRPGSTLELPLQRFLAVVSNFFRSFLSDVKRSQANIPLRQVLPPLAVFQREGRMGPFAITVEETARIFGAKVGVVSMPATYADHPLIWAILAHETGGHSVTHADPGLLDQLAASVPLAVAGTPASPSMPRDLLTLLWSYWMDEASSDVYGILNLGPAFSINMAAFFSAAGSAGGTLVGPTLRMKSSFDPKDPAAILDPHPTDILRLHLAIGAIETLTDLSPDIRLAYIDLIQGLSELLAKGDFCTINGKIPVERDRLVEIKMDFPLAPMQELARHVGGLIATIKLQALNGKSIQEIETWDDYDESRSQAVRKALLGLQPIATLGDDAHLLAGATMALMMAPEQYDSVTAALNTALDQSFRRDPIWGSPSVDKVFFSGRSAMAGSRSFWPGRGKTATSSFRVWGK